MLKPDQDILAYEVGFFMNTTAEGGVVVVSYTGTVGSGAAMDNANQSVEVASNPSGRYPIGVLLNTFVNKDLTQQTLNPYKFPSERQVGDKAAILKKGMCVTNAILGSTTASVVPGQPAYLHGTGFISSQLNPQVGYSAAQVGKFLSKVDQDGYVKVFIDL